VTSASSLQNRVAIVTGASQGIGAGLVAAFRKAGYAVVATSRSIRPSDEPDFLTVQGDIAQVETAARVVEHAVDHFGRIDTLINNAGLFIGKSFTDYTADDYAAITDREPGWFLPHHPARYPANGHPAQRPCRERHH
jgi:NAD(P)-dependent dehydrogenase (short-subunit alcohol dehydrogenase family)